MITRNINTHSDFLTGKSDPISELRAPQKRKENTPKQSIQITELGAHETPTLTSEPVKTKKKASLAEITNNSISAGLSDFNDKLLSTIDYLLPTEFLGKYDFVSSLADYYSREADKYSEKRLDSISDRGKFVQESSNLLTGLSSAAPSAFLAAMTGGGSAAAQGTTASLTAASGAAQSSGLLSTAASATQELAKNPMFWSSVGQTLGSNYEKAKETGASELQANGYAFASSFLNGALEASGGIDTLPGVLKSGTGPATAWARSALTEGLEEPVQSTVSGLSEKLFYNWDKPLVSLTDSSAVIHPGRMGQEFSMGTAVGGILCAGQLAGSRLYMNDPDVLAQRGDYSGYVRELQEIIDRQKADELLAEYEKHVVEYPSPQKTVSSDMWIPVFQEQDQYEQWLHSIGAQGTQLDTLEKYTAAKYNDTWEYQLLTGYGKAVRKGSISPLVGFEEYGLTSELIQESVVGTRTPTGVQIESFTPHFIDRVIGQTSTDHSGMRRGVSVEDVVDALENPVEDGPIWRMEDGDIRQKFLGRKVSVVVSVRDLKLIQTNPIGEK